MSLRSSLYSGIVTHRRLRPKPHDLRYRCYWMLIDLDELDVLDQHLRVFSTRRFSMFEFRQRDHGDGSDKALKAQVQALLREVGVQGETRIRLLCMPRILGYGFNPLSVFFIGDETKPDLILYEVHNTFSERHSYLIPVTSDTKPIRQRADKRFYVSPFMDMNLTYDFTVTPPSDKLAIHIAARDESGPLLSASLTGQRIALSDRALLRLFFSQPLLTLKVIAAIHIEAAKLVLKGLRIRDRIPVKSHQTTIVKPGL